MTLRTIRRLISRRPRQSRGAIERRKGPQLAPGLRIYAIGDIHGRLDLLKRLLGLIDNDLQASPVEFSCAIFLGDYVDRGPSSKGVLEHLIEAPKVSDEYIFLRGNHEEVLLSFLEDASVMAEWSQFGGLETLYSYGVNPRLPLNSNDHPGLQRRFRDQLPPSHREFLMATPTFFEAGGYFFVHAGVRPGVALADQNPSDLLWIRDEFLFATYPFEKIIVHGHTPVETPELLPRRINVDTGAYLTGRLSCVVLEGADRRLLAT